MAKPGPRGVQSLGQEGTPTLFQLFLPSFPCPLSRATARVHSGMGSHSLYRERTKGPKMSDAHLCEDSSPINALVLGYWAEETRQPSQ